MGLTLILASFFSGTVMFFAPCTLPLVPGFLAFVSGGDKKKVIKNSLVFVLGFSLVFIVFGALAGFLGSKLFVFKSIISKVGGILVIFFGLYILGVFRLKFFEKTRNIFVFRSLKPGTKKSSFILGVSFATGWTPCVGPILASILLLAGTTQTIFTGVFLLIIFSLGLAIPFIISALFFDQLKKINFNSSVVNIFSKISGVFLIFVGILLVTDNFFLVTRWGFSILDFLNYNQILERL